MRYTYKTAGTCSSQIDFDIEDGRISNVSFTGGCNGNLKGISALVEGMEATRVAALLGSIRCGGKTTSCPAQLAQAITRALEASSSD